MNSVPNEDAGNPIRYQGYCELPAEFYEASLPAGSPEPSLIELNTGFLDSEGIDSDWFETGEALAFLAGNGPCDIPTLAMAYSGHQFGHWVPLLGDGRAHMLGQMRNAEGSAIDVQLKGSGQTRFSRGGDGRATLGSVLREYIVSEAMAALGIPATRSLAVITTGETIMREGPQPGAILVRTARSHIRVGSFQYAAASQGEAGVKALADFMIIHHFPSLQGTEDQYAAFLREVVDRQAKLIAQWMLVGFIHGVMNTDNMSIVGETIDFGPCAFMDEFHPQKVFSSIDHHGRYAWGEQPNIGLWNLSQFAGTLLPLLHSDKDEAESAAKAQLDHFGPAFRQHFNDGMLRKLGLSEEVSDEDAAGLVESCFAVLTEKGMDFTVFFDHLTRVASGKAPSGLIEMFNDAERAEAWLARWSALRSASPEVAETMRRSNPALIARNHRVEEAIEAATRKNDFAPFRRLCKALLNPYEVDVEDTELQQPPKPEERVMQTFCGT